MKKRCCVCRTPYEAVRTYPGKSIKLPWCSPECGFQHAKNLKRKKEEEEAKEEKEQRKQNKLKDKAIREQIESKGYFEKKLQPIVNHIARIIDYDLSCIALEQWGQMHGGHFKAVKGSESIRFNLHNIHRQCAQSNEHHQGDEARYRLGLIRDYGQAYLEMVDGLKLKYRGRQKLWTKKEIIDAIPKAQEIRRRLKKEIKTVQDPTERIRLRDWVNKELGLYE